MTTRLSHSLEAKLVTLGRALVDQDAARVVVEPQSRAAGFWFGGGNIAQRDDGTCYLVGRYRNQGDSRTGVNAGQRGLELAIFTSNDQGLTWDKQVAFAKADLHVGNREVLSIEGSALRWTQAGVELFVSTEKTKIGYPQGLEDYLKPGTGVWTIERLVAPDVASLPDADIQTVLETDDPRFMHVKDPVLYEREDGSTVMFYCTHPFSWSSSNTAYAVRHADAASFATPDYTFFPRGETWDVAMTRGTAVVPVPRVGPFAEQCVSLVFYDGGECLRNLDEHATAVKRPRGYSCEELGGLAYVIHDDFSSVFRLSAIEPMFISPHGTGCSRYVDVLTTEDALIATWQQSQDDLSQPLVMNQVSRQQVHAILA